MLCTQADVEALRQVDITAEPDPTILALITHAEGIIGGLCDRRFDAVTDYRVEGIDLQYADGVVYLPHYPVTSATIHHSDDTEWGGPSELSKKGLIRLWGYGTGVTTWDWEWHIVPTMTNLPDHVIYTGGTDDPDNPGAEHPGVPQDLRTLCAQVASMLFDVGSVSSAGPGIQSESIGSWAISYKKIEEQLSLQQMRVIRKYAHQVPSIAV